MVSISRIGNLATRVCASDARFGRFNVGDQSRTMVAYGRGRTPDISIIIRSKNEERFIAQVLSALYQQEIDLTFEVLVVDSGSTDQTLEIVRKYSARVNEICAREFSYGRALNYGASLAKGRYLINLSAHCIPSNSRWMARLIECLRSQSKVVATYGGQLPIKGVNPFEERAMMELFAPGERGAIRAPFSNSNCAIRRETWEQFPFDETASFAEDFIWSQTLPNEYEIRYVPDAAVYHSHPLQLTLWATRAYNTGVVVEYLKHVYGFQYPWARDNMRDRSKSSRWEVVRKIGRYTARHLKLLLFLIRNGYVKCIPVWPMYSLTEQFYYRKGLVDGFRRYGHSRVVSHE